MEQAGIELVVGPGSGKNHVVVVAVHYNYKLMDGAVGLGDSSVLHHFSKNFEIREGLLVAASGATIVVSCRLLQHVVRLAN